MQNKQPVKGVAVFHTHKQGDEVSYYKKVCGYKQMNKIQAGADNFRHSSAQVRDGH